MVALWFNEDIDNVIILQILSRTGNRWSSTIPTAVTNPDNTVELRKAGSVSSEPCDQRLDLQKEPCGNGWPEGVSGSGRILVRFANGGRAKGYST